MPMIRSVVRGLVGPVARGVAYTDAPPTPAAPSSLTATAISDTEIDLAWTDNSSNETGFRVEQSANGTTGWSEVTTTAADATSYSVTGLTAATTYYYRVIAENAQGDSDPSNTANDTTLNAASFTGHMNGSDGVSIDNGTMYTSSVGGYYNLSGGTVTALSNRANIASLAGVWAKGAGSSYGNAAVNISADFYIPSTPTGYVGLLIRGVNSGSYWYFAFNGANVVLVKRVNNSETTVGTWAHGQSYPITASLRVIVSGNDWACYVDGVLRITATDADLNTGTRHGFNVKDTPAGAWFDNLILRVP